MFLLKGTWWYCWWTKSGKLTSWGKGSLSHHLRGCVHPRWLFGISSINSSSELGINWHRTLEKRSSNGAILEPFTRVLTFNIPPHLEVSGNNPASIYIPFNQSHSFTANVLWDLANVRPPRKTLPPKKKKLQLHFASHIFTGWWLNQPLWKICSSNWKSSLGIGVKIKNISNHHLVYHCPCPLPNKCPIQVIFRGRFVRPTIQHVCTTSPEVAAEAVAQCGSLEGSENWTFKATLEVKGLRRLNELFIIWYECWVATPDQGKGFNPLKTNRHSPWESPSKSRESKMVDIPWRPARLQDSKINWRGMTIPGQTSCLIEFSCHQIPPKPKTHHQSHPLIHEESIKPYAVCQNWPPKPTL